MKRIRDYQSNITDIIKMIDNKKEGIYDSFLNELKLNGAPLEEQYDDKHNLITFIYISNFECKNVLLILPLYSENIEDNLMDRVEGTDMWYSTYKMRNDIRFGYCFSPNDSLEIECELRHKNLEKDIFNSDYTLIEIKSSKRKYTRSNFKLNNATQHTITSSNCHGEKGRIVEYSFDSKILNENRRVRVYIPFGYTNDSVGLDYLLLTDGEEHLKYLSVDLILDNLIYQKKIPKTICILIDSTENRYNELKCNDKFSRFIVDELIIWIRSIYKISKNPKKAIVSGFSLGGLTAAFLAIHHPHIFGNVLSQSGSFWYAPNDQELENNICWISKFYTSDKSNSIKIYLNVGRYENKELMIDTNEYLKRILLKANYDVELEYFNSGHDYLSWGEYLGRGLVSLFQRREFDN